MESHDFKLGFIDLLLCSFVSIVVLFFMTTLMISPIKKIEQEGIKKDAQFTIHAEWNKNIDCDVDLWVKNPSGTVIYFRMKDADLMNLDRDDFGKTNDYIIVDGKRITADRNDEFATLRAIIPGTFTVNVHLYTCLVDGTGLVIGALPPEEINVKVTLIKLNPKLEISKETTVTLTRVWQEKTAFSFKMDADGTVHDFDSIPTKLVSVYKNGQGM